MYYIKIILVYSFINIKSLKLYHIYKMRIFFTLLG